jgi:ABC-type glutathione transport system ATPase component
MSNEVLVVEHLRKEFRRRRGAPGGESQHLIAVDDVSFAVAPGGALAIVGESGSGKTTTARMIVGLEWPTAGSISVAGRVRSARRVPRRERKLRGREIQIVFQDPYLSLDPRQTVGSCLDEVLRFHFRWDSRTQQQRREALLAHVGLDARFASRLPRSMSGGQRQRVAIARALAAEPQVLVLDEAVSALDVSVQAQVLNCLADLRAETGVSYVFISHDLSVVRQISDDIIVMKSGKIAERGRTDVVLDAPQSDYARELLASVPRPGWHPRRRVVAASATPGPEPVG